MPDCLHTTCNQVRGLLRNSVCRRRRGCLCDQRHDRGVCDPNNARPTKSQLAFKYSALLSREHGARPCRMPDRECLFATSVRRQSGFDQMCARDRVRWLVRRSYKNASVGDWGE